jgi:thioredoxin reductase
MALSIREGAESREQEKNYHPEPCHPEPRTGVRGKLREGSYSGPINCSEHGSRDREHGAVGNIIVETVSKKNGLVTFVAGAVVLAMGCRERPRGALSISGSRPAGVFTAGFAQKMVNMEGLSVGKRIVILGSGDIGLIMARRMTWEGSKVIMVCELMHYSSGLNRNIVQCLNDNDIPLYFSTTVVRIHGKERVEGVTIAKVDENRNPIKETETYIECDTLLLSVGLLPENELTIAAGIEMDPVTGGAIVDNFRQTSLTGVFSCGNVLHVHDLADNASSEAQTAGKAAAEYAKDSGKSLKTTGASETYAVKGIGLVRYTVPQRIRKGSTVPISLYFRVGDVQRNAEIVVMCGEKMIKRKKKTIVTPGEMEKIDIEGTDCVADITVEVR